MKKITIILMTAAVLLSCITSWAYFPAVKKIYKLDCVSGAKIFFSTDPDDYMLAFKLLPQSNQHIVTVYGRLAKGHDWSEVEEMKSFKEVYSGTYPFDMEEAVAWYGYEAAYQKLMPIRFREGTPTDQIGVVTPFCEVLPKVKGSDLVPFRCKSSRLPDPKTWGDLDKLTQMFSAPYYAGEFIRIEAADPCVQSSRDLNYQEMFLRWVNAPDVDEDGVPDSFDEEKEEAPQEEIAVSEEEEVAAPSIPTEETPYPTDLGKIYETEPLVPGGAEKGQACSLTSAANANPVYSLLLIAALLALVRRRKEQRMP